MKPMREILQNSATLRRIYYRLQLLSSKGQSNESEIIDRLARNAPRTFVEFGFHPIEFNCAWLAKNKDWRGLLVDGSPRQVEDARALLPNRIRIIEQFLTLDNLDFIKQAFAEIGVLSIDVDGNDYWLLKELIATEPSLICVEYNSTLGLAPITVPYDPAFDRHAKHPRAWYHGASITALAKLCSGYGYGLAAVSELGTNAFFTRDGTLSPCKEWRPNSLRLKYSGVSHDDQWESVKHMAFQEV